MATLSAWLFDTPDGASQAENLLLDLQKQQVLVVQDAAIGELAARRLETKDP